MTWSILLLSVIAICHGELLRVCYYTSWSQFRHSHYAVLPNQLDADLCTHINFAFADLNATALTIVPFDSKHEIPLYSEVNDLKLKNPNLKTLLSVGGWNMGSDPFVEIVSSQENMLAFASNAISFLRRYNFDGLDLDWEYPAARGSKHKDKEGFVSFLKVLRHAFDNEGSKSPLLLTAAVGVSEFRIRQSYDVPALSQYLDFINLMMYDFHGQWEDTVNVHSALFSDNDFNIDRFVKKWVTEGAAKHKLILGVPFYGHSFTLSNINDTEVGSNSTDGGTITYIEICEKEQRGEISPVRLSRERVPYYVENGVWVGYDDVQSITEKGEYIRTNGYGGAMVWAVDFDDVTGECNQGKYPLMNALKSALGSEGVVIG